MDDSKSLHTSHSKLTLRRQSPAVTLTSVLLLCQPILYLAEHLYNTASILTRNRILLYDRKKSMLLWLCFVDSLLDHRSEVDQLHIGAVFSKFSRLQSVQQLPSKSEKQSEQLYLDLRIYLSSNWKKKKKIISWEKQKHILQVSFLPLNETLHTAWRISKASGYCDGHALLALKVCQETKLAMSVVRWGRTMGFRSQTTGCSWSVNHVWSAGHTDTEQMISKKNCRCGWAWGRSWLQIWCSVRDKNWMQSFNSMCFH